MEKERLAAAKQHEIMMSHVYTFGSLLMMFGLHCGFFYMFGKLASSFADRTLSVFVTSSKLVTLGLFLFVSVGGVYFWHAWWFWLCTLSVGYLVFFELSPTTSLKDTKVKSD